MLKNPIYGFEISGDKIFIGTIKWNATNRVGHLADAKIDDVWMSLDYSADLTNEARQKHETRADYICRALNLLHELDHPVFETRAEMLKRQHGGRIYGASIVASQATTDEQIRENRSVLEKSRHASMSQARGACAYEIASRMSAAAADIVFGKQVPAVATENQIDHMRTAARAANNYVVGQMEDPAARERMLMHAVYVAAVENSPCKQAEKPEPAGIFPQQQQEG